MTEENRAEVLPRFFHRSRQEAKEIVVELRPVEHAPTRTVVTRAPAVQPVEPDLTHPEGTSRRDGAPEAGAAPSTSVVRPPGERPVIEPVSRVASRMHITVSREFLALLKKARDGEAHARPGATVEEVLRSGLELLVRQQERRRARVPAKLKRAVRARDGVRGGRPRRAAWPRRPLDRGELADALQDAQPGGRARRLRRCAHGPVLANAVRRRTG